MNPEWILASLFLLGGAVAMAAALMNWDWFFATASARAVGGTRSRRVARMFYGVAGALMIIAAVYLFTL